MKKFIIIPVLAIVSLQACVAKKILKQSQMETAALRLDSMELANRNSSLTGNISVLDKNIAALQANIKSLNSEVASLSNQNGQLGQQTANQQSQLNKTKEELQDQQQKLMRLQSLLEQQKAQGKLLKDKMAEALKGFSSNELTVVQKNGKVYVVSARKP